MKQKQLYKSVLFLIGLTLLSGVLYTMGDFYNMPFRGMKDLFILIAQFLVIEIAIFLFMWCIASNKYVFAILYPIYTLACSVATYFRYTAQISLTAATIDLSITNDFRTTMDVVTIPLILFVIVTELICIGIIYIRIKYIRFSHSWLQFILAFIGLTLYISIPRISLPIKSRIPFVIYFSINDYLDNRNIIEENRPAFKQKGICKSDSIDVVFIIGETLRSKNMQINGYHRSTTPFRQTATLYPCLIFIQNMDLRIPVYHICLPEHAQRIWMQPIKKDLLLIFSKKQASILHGLPTKKVLILTFIS